MSCLYGSLAAFETDPDRIWYCYFSFLSYLFIMLVMLLAIYFCSCCYVFYLFICLLQQNDKTTNRSHRTPDISVKSSTLRVSAHASIYISLLLFFSLFLSSLINHSLFHLIYFTEHLSIGRVVYRPLRHEDQNFRAAAKCIRTPGQKNQ